MIVKACYLYRSTCPVLGEPDNDADIAAFLGTHGATATAVDAVVWGSTVFEETLSYADFSTAVGGSWASVKYIDLAYTLSLYLET